jgi:serine/threonine-protein kinase
VVLHDYRLDRLIEQHVWGPIFLASDKTGASFVVRFMETPFSDTQSWQGNGAPSDMQIRYLGRFQQEANRIAVLQHPHILPLIAYGNFQGLPYLVYPYASLLPLRNLLGQGSRLPNDVLSVGTYLEPLASALGYAHEQAVLHRNLSTNTIYMQKNGQMVITEFGLMRIRELGRQIMQEQSAEARGNQYEGSTEGSAPEQLLGKPIDAAADIYSLGAVLYRMLSAHPPFTGRTREEIARQHLYSEVPSLGTWRADLPAGLDAVIAQAMAKDPAQRFHLPTDLVRAYYAVVAPERVPLVSTSGPVASVNTSPQQAFSNLDSTPYQAYQPRTEQGRSVRNASKAHMRASRRRVLIAAGGGVAVVAVAAILGTRFLNGNTMGSTGGTVQSNTSGTKQAGASNGSGQAAPTQSTNGQTKAATPTTGAQKQPTKSGNGNAANVLARTADLPVNSSKTFAIAGQKNPGILIHLPNNSFVAFDSTCTHAACSVPYNTQTHLLECPCHGAVFDPAQGAKVKAGPAPTPLTPIKIVVNGDGTITKV